MHLCQKHIRKKQRYLIDSYLRLMGIGKGEFAKPFNRIFRNYSHITIKNMHFQTYKKNFNSNYFSPLDSYMSEWIALVFFNDFEIDSMLL